MITLESATQFAAWLALNHPELFRELALHTPFARSQLSGLGDSSLDQLQPVNVTAQYIDPSSIGDTNPADQLAPVNVSAQYIDPSTLDLSSLNSALNSSLNAQLQSQPVSMSSVDQSTSLPSWSDLSSVNTAATVDPTASASSNSGGFWSTVGSALSSAGSGIVKAVGSVGSYLTSQQGMGTLATLAHDYFQGQALQSQAQILQTQQQRAVAGLSPAPVGYAYNQAGQLVPVAATQQGLMPATPGIVSQYAPGALPAGSLPGAAPPGTMSSYLPWIMGGAGLLMLFMFMMGPNRQSE